MAKFVGSPILPKNINDPTGGDSLERAAIKEFKKRLKKCNAAYIEALNKIPVSVVAVNAKYEFRLDTALLNAILSGASNEVDLEILAGGSDKLWFFEQFVYNAYNRGTAQEYANLANQSAVYKAGRGDVAEIIRSEPYRRRIALIRSRAFEEVSKLSSEVKSDLARILTDGIARGKNPLEIARNVKGNLPIEEKRAKRIARTEITTALRRARMDESDEAAEDYNLKMKQMQISALSPTTRKSHAARHSKLYTTDELREWWSEDGNSVNCKCSTVSVLVNDAGEPLVPTIIERARKNRDIMEAKGYKWADEG